MKTRIAAALAAVATTMSIAAMAAPQASLRAETRQAWTRTVVRTPLGYRIGNPAAPVRLVEYGSRTCPACRNFARAGLGPLMTRYVAGGRVSFEFRDLMVHGAADLAAALVGQCGAPASFFPILEATYADQDRALDALRATPAAEQATMKDKSPGQLLEFISDKAGYATLATRFGVTRAQSRACLNDKAGMERLARITDQTSEALAPGTPSFLINGTRIEALSWPEVEAALRKAGA